MSVNTVPFHFLRLAVVLFVLWLLAGCASNKKAEELMLGAWTGADETNKGWIVSFKKGGELRIAFTHSNIQYTGTYSIIDNSIKFVDLYCGTKLPGVYRARFKPDEMILEKLDDPICDRGRHFMGKWTKIEKAPDESNGSGIL